MMKLRQINPKIQVPGPHLILYVQKLHFERQNFSKYKRCIRFLGITRNARFMQYAKPTYYSIHVLQRTVVRYWKYGSSAYLSFSSFSQKYSMLCRYIQTCRHQSNAKRHSTIPKGFSVPLRGFERRSIWVLDRHLSLPKQIPKPIQVHIPICVSSSDAILCSHDTITL